MYLAGWAGYIRQAIFEIENITVADRAGEGRVISHIRNFFEWQAHRLYQVSTELPASVYCPFVIGSQGSAQIGTMIAFNRLVTVFISYNDSKGTNHNAGPAGYTSVRIVDDFPCFPVPGNSPGNTCLSAKGIFAVAALQGYRTYCLGRFFRANALHMNPVFGQGMLSHRIRKRF
jgi:hypothetical protein